MEPFAKPTHNAVRRFADALRLALYDYELEKTADIHYYCDADVVVKIILGFRQFHDSHSPWRLDTLLLRALISNGYLGTICMLRPHALELDASIRCRPSDSEPYVKVVKSFLENEGVTGHMVRLHRIISSKKSDVEKQTQFLAELQQMGTRTFVAIELARGTWQQRFKDICETLNLHHLGAEMAEILETDALREVHGVLSKIRSDKGAELSNLRDAAAIAILHGQIREWESGGYEPLVRFYTETQALHAAWCQNDAVREYLSYAKAPNGIAGGWDERFVVRDVDYYLVRARFSGIRFPGVAQTPGSSDLDVQQLIGISAKLTAMMTTGAPEYDTALDETELGGRPLSEIIAEYETLSFLKSIWRNYNPPPTMTQHIPHWTDVWSFGTQNSVGSSLDQGIDEARGMLHERVSRIEEWQQHFQEVHDASARHRREMKDFVDPDPMRDLGLVRWGFELSPDERTQIQAHIRGILNTSAPEWARGCGSFAAFVESVSNDERACIVACAILWLLDLYHCASDLISQCKKVREGVIDRGLRLMRQAARLLAEEPLDVQTANTRIVTLGELRSAIPKGSEELGRFLLGFGYVLYAAWEAGKAGLKAGALASEKDVVREWGTSSFDVVDEAAGYLKRRSLAWAFAVNHCAYVGTVTDYRVSETNSYMLQLVELRRTSMWHYRFEDTWAWQFFVSAQRQWEAAQSDESRGDISEVRRRACADLARARESLERAEPDFGNAHIAQHRMELENLQRRIGCLG